jgi:secretion/DNA translocation related TadE-like protein
VRDDRGSATVLVLALAGLLVLVGLLLTALAAVAVTRHRAASTADLAALAAADLVLEGPDVACSAAARVTVRDRAELSSCHLEGDVVEVAVALRPGGVLGTFGAARAVARAGPSATAGTP